MNSNFPPDVSTIAMKREIVSSENMVQKFQLASADQIKEINLKSPNKCCDLNPEPTWLLKKSRYQLIPLTMAIINKSVANKRQREAL